MLIAGYLQARDFILQPFVKFPLVILISIFLTVSFWILQRAGRRGISLIFIGILFFNIGMPFYASIISHEIIKTLEQDAGKGIDPQLAELLLFGDDVREREMAAKVIYTRHGISLPYKNADTGFTAYVPNKADQDQFFVAHQQRLQAEAAIGNMHGQIEASNFLIALQLFLFIILLIFLLLYDRPVASTAQERLCPPAARNPDHPHGL
jgi:hypothetical protein